jgi:[protein-PII] uridylyltransferase
VTATDRRARADAADALCAAAFARAVAGARQREPAGLALVAVGGYGRRELAPHSDLDMVLVHTHDSTGVSEVAGALWYPLWDAGVPVDHSVRNLSEVTAAAKQDVRVALGLLDARHVAGDPTVTLRLRSALLAQWRRDSKAQLPALKELVLRRVERFGELAHASVPDLKECGGGLRDATILNALRATWMVDVPHGDLEPARRWLLDVRDQVQLRNARGSDRIAPDAWEDLAENLRLADREEAQRHVRQAGRRISHLSRLTWRRVDGALAPGRAGSRRRPGPVLRPVASGVAVVGGDVVLQPGAEPAGDPALLLRAATQAAENDLVLAPATAARLAREGGELTDPWPVEARDLLVRLLGAGPGLLPVWETLDETGALTRLLPEWERIRLLPHASVVNRCTVDRHVVETCVEAARLVRRVARPDLLLLAALLHDIGKGSVSEHCAAGEPVARAVATRIGLEPHDVDTVGTLVRRHLLLADVATTRDLEDPATVEHVVGLVRDADTLRLLSALTEADARATSAQAWTSWRAALVTDLVRRVEAVLDERPQRLGGPVAPDPVEIRPGLEDRPNRVDVRVEAADHGCAVTVISVDGIGVLAAAAGAIGSMHAGIRSARAWTQGGFAVSRWHLDASQVDAAVLRHRIEAVLDGRLDPVARLQGGASAVAAPSVAVRPEASLTATVLEVRAEALPGVVYLVCRALAQIGVAVRSAHLATFGPQAVEVFYLQEQGAGAMGDERAAAAAHAVRRALTCPVTLDP